MFHRLLELLCIENNSTKSSYLKFWIALFWSLYVPEDDLKPFRRVTFFGGLLPLKQTARKSRVASLKINHAKNCYF